MPEPEVVEDPSRPGALVVRQGSLEVVVTREQVARFEAAVTLFGEGMAKAAAGLKKALNEWQLERQNEQLREQNRLLGERHQQLERMVASAFARSVSMLTQSTKGSYSGPRRLGTGKLTDDDAARESVRLLEDYVRAEQLLREGKVECESVSHGVRLLLANQRDQPVIDTELVVGTATCPEYPDGHHYRTADYTRCRCGAALADAVEVTAEAVPVSDAEPPREERD